MSLGSQPGKKANMKRRSSRAFNFFRQPPGDRSKSTSENKDTRPISRLSSLKMNNTDLATALERSHKREADLKEEIYQLQKDNLDLISKLQCLKNEQFVDQWDSVTQKRIFMKKLIDMIELLTEAAMGMPHTNRNDLIMTSDSCDREILNEQQCEEQLGDEQFVKRPSFNNTPKASDKNFAITSSSVISTHIVEHPPLYKVTEEKNGEILLEERETAEKEGQANIYLQGSFHSVNSMEACDAGTRIDDSNDDKMSVDEASSRLPTKRFHVFEDGQTENCPIDERTFLPNDHADQHFSKRERRIFKRLQRIERENNRKSKGKSGSNRRLRRRRVFASEEAMPTSTKRPSQIYLGQEDKENINFSCEQKRHRGLQNHNMCCSPVTNVVRRMFSPIHSRSPILRRESRNKRKVSYTEPSLSKKLRRGDPTTDSSLYASPHFGYKKKSKLQEQSRRPLMQIGGSIREEK